jgi:hypothetical protein
MRTGSRPGSDGDTGELEGEVGSPEAGPPVIEAGCAAACCDPRRRSPSR